jgi:phage shock protein E
MKLDQIASVVDVRTPEEFAGGHYPGAVNIPLDELTQRIIELKEMKKPIIMYCKSGGRSGVAISILRQNGIANVINGGGIDDLLQVKNSFYV